MTMRVHSQVWQEGRKLGDDLPLDRIKDLEHTPGALCWVDLVDPEPADIEELAERLHLDAHSAEDVLAPGERPKAHRHRDRLFCTVYALAVDDTAGRRGYLVAERVSIWVLGWGIITVHGSGPFNPDELADRYDASSDLVTNGPLGLLHGLLDLIVDGHFDVVQAVDDALEELEDGLFDPETDPRRLQREVYRIRKALVKFRGLVLPMREVVSTITRPGPQEIELPRALDSYYNDLYDHTLRVAEWTDSLRDLLSTIFETNLSIQDSRLNEVMKKLAGWAGIIAVPTLITGWFGQNIPFPGDGTPLGLAISVGLIIATTALLYWVFKRKDWL